MTLVNFLRATIPGVLLLVAVSATHAQSAAPAVPYPTKAIRILLSFVAGGTTDLVARTVGQKLSESMGIPVAVDNRPGANGIVATQLVSKSTPDGYTLLFSTAGNTSVAMAVMGQKLPFDPFRELTPIILLTHSTQMIVAHPSLRVRSIRELVKLGKSRPGDLVYATTGVGNQTHLGMEWLKQLGGFDMTHVPYKGGAQAVIDLSAGRVHLMFTSMVSTLPYVKSGKLVPLAVGSKHRSRAMPEVPTVAESGYPTFEVSTWYGMYGPIGVPREITTRLNSEMNKALADAGLVKLFSTQGLEPAGGSPEDLNKQMREEYERWRKLLATTKIQVEQQ